MKKIIALTAILAAALAVTSRAQLVNVDFGGGPLFTGTGVAGGGTWNTYGGSGASGSLVDSTGAASGITFDIASSFGNTDNTGGTNPTTNPATAALFEDFIRGAFNNNLTVTFSGLVPLQTYDLTIYASGATTGTGAAFVSSNFLGTTTGADRGAFVLGDNYMRHNVTADAMGMVAVVASPTNGDGAVFNGLQIAAVPEPSTWALLSAGGAGLLGLTSRRRRGRAA